MEQVTGSSMTEFLVVASAIAIVFVGLAVVLKVIEWANRHWEWFDADQ